MVNALCHQWQPQERGVHPHPPAMELEESLADDFAPFEGAANTDNWTVFFALEHFGQVIACDEFITMRS
jgi:hypothetical protein